MTIKILITVLFSIVVLSGCEPARNFDRAVTMEDIKYFDQMSNEENAKARQRIRKQFSEGLQLYRLAVGDVVELIFMFRPRIETEEYRIHVGDKINVEFFYHKEISRSLRVRPDGRITLPIKGEIRAAGLTPVELSKKIRLLMADMLVKLDVTVSVEEFTGNAEAFMQSIKDADIAGATAQTYRIAPDGRLYPPFIGGIKAAGKTLDDVRGKMNEVYEKDFKNVSVSVKLREIVGNRIFVFGEVRAPGAYNLQGPHTILQSVALAGGWLPTAALDNVRVAYWDKDRNPRIRSVNLKKIAEKGQVSLDMVLPANSTIYVMPSAITVADRIVDQYVRRLFLWNGVNFGLTYELNSPGN